MVCGPDASPANVRAERARELGDYTAGVIRACRGTRPGDALRPNRQPQKPRPKPPQNAMCLGSCSRSPDGWPGWPIAACARHARFRLNDRPQAGLHGGPSASCGYAPVIQVQGSPARVDRLINHHFRQNPHGAHSLPLPLCLSASAPLALALGMDASRSTSLACRPPCALHLFPFGFFIWPVALPNFRELGPTIPNASHGLHPDPRQCRGKAAHGALTSPASCCPCRGAER